MVVIDQSSNLAMEDHKPNVVFLPYFTTSHMIPMVEFARQLAARGAKSTIITTHRNAALFQSSIDHDTASGHHISSYSLDFPSKEVGLPKGIENFSNITSPEMIEQVASGIHFLQKPMEETIHQLSPDCIVSDMFFPWTVEAAEQLEVPRLLFYPSSVFESCVSISLKLHSPHKKASSEAGSFLIPGLPEEIEMKTSQLPDFFISETEFGKLIDLIKASELRSYGIVFDSFHELAPNYTDYFKNSTKFKTWHVGPLSHFPNLKIPKKGNNITATFDTTSTIKSWLDEQSPRKVVYICFGTMTMFSEGQLSQIALALEASQHPFIWVVRKQEENEENNWLPKGFDERLAESKRGILIRGWAPQVMILNHSAVGGYVTHCGWNSVVESIMAGVPLITWPLFAEQFFNEKLITAVLKIGIRVGSDVHNSSFKITSPVVEREKIEQALNILMWSSEETEEIRRRVKELGVMATRAMEEGGSSHNDLTAVFEEIKACALQKM